MELFNDRRSLPSSEEDGERLLDRDSLKDANARIRAAVPEYDRANVNRKIRTNAVHRHRGKKQFETVSEYMNFIWGNEDGSE